MKKNLLVLLSLILIPVLGNSQSFKGKDKVSFFQAPAEKVKFSSANVFLSTDKALQEAKRETSKAKVSKFGSKLGGFGAAMAGAVNKTIDKAAEINKMIDAIKDEEGRFAVWNFVPAYIKYDMNSVKEKVNVEIFVLSETPKTEMGTEERMPTTADKEGYYLVPWSVNCRYQVTSAQGEVIYEDNLGLVSGKTKTKKYTPAAPAKLGSISQAPANDALSVSDEIGVNEAYKRVHKEVFSHFGFGQFTVAAKLGSIKEIKELNKLTKPTVALFENKKGLLLNKDEKATLADYIMVLEPNISKCSDKTRWVAYHNLSLCYAWMENVEKSQEYLKKYAGEIEDTFGKIKVFNQLVKGELSKEQRVAAKAEYGSIAIGTKDMKKYSNYKDIESFVNFYPKGANAYPALLTTINRNLSQFVDFYAHNDLLCQLFELDYPFQFLPLQDFTGLPKTMTGQITKEGDEPVDFTVKFDSKRRVKKLEASQIGIAEDGSKDKIITRDIKPVYNEAGKYAYMEVNAGMFAEYYGKTTSYTKIDEISDPLVGATHGAANNITKNIGFMGGKVSEEDVQLMVDLEGKVYFTGKSALPRVNAIFKDLLNANGFVPKKPKTTTEFETIASINEDGVFTEWNWNGTTHTHLAGSKGVGQQNINADKMIRDMKFSSVDDHGNPVKIHYDLDLAGKLSMNERMSFKGFMNYAFLAGAGPQVSSDNFTIDTGMDWDCEFVYDAQGNWTEMKVGPYKATRTFKY
ncbi:hypothetical protein BZG01_07225 [Labilibaculum manganireducens]|uniref:Tetratricopeptide repeat protein n=1 Tax=Labilibaculum manganireducens TaxID=1940525 RepID=A0A2N3IB35_9BACT|nr:hypothetical protein [Labilibaculum manganireducens]PKQ67521.1 hypothetical protein BZG01_07225 [Labilibaculum manganireducens]